MKKMREEKKIRVRERSFEMYLMTVAQVLPLVLYLFLLFQADSSFYRLHSPNIIPFHPMYTY